MELISNEEKITQALLVSVDTGEYDSEASKYNKLYLDIYNYLFVKKNK